MCGIIGILGSSDVSDRLIEALRRLEYRGYDSAGVATLHDGIIDRRRAEGKLREQLEAPRAEPLRRPYRHRPHPLGHARRADRGNAHPHRPAGSPWSTTASSRISLS
jgi:glucosamine--fructose-6-phosphate aminotransferase (isomerizing)